MTISMKKATFLLTGTIAAGMYGGVSFAADVASPTTLPAVSGPNGKLQIGTGWADINSFSNDAEFRGGAAFSFPVGDMFGIQGDLTAVDVFKNSVVSGAVHAFTRDPNSYLLGVYGGYAGVDHGNFWYAGPEVELYLNNISIEAVAGFMDVNGSGLSNKNDFYAVGDLALYATDNLRLSVGASTVAGFDTGRVGLEWFMADTVNLPVSFTLDGRVGEDGFGSVMAGLNLYFGGEDKSLIRRHREDDPPLQFLEVFGAFLAQGVPTCPEGLFWDPEAQNGAGECLPGPP